MTQWMWQKRRIMQAAMAALLFCLSIFSVATTTPSVTLLLTASDPVYQAVSTSIQTSVKTHVIFKEYTLDSIKDIPGSSDPILTVGSSAFKEAMNKFPEQSIIASFLPRRVFEQLLSESQRNLNNTTAVFIDQSMTRQLSLVRIIIPNGKTIGTVFGTSSLIERQRLYQAAEATGFTIKSVVLNSQDNPIKTLQPIIQRTDLFLAIPDRSAFNRASAKWSLYISLRAKKPLIGFSEKYVDAGALAAVYSSPEQVGKHTAETLDSFLTSGLLPEPEHPRYFSVKTNQKSAEIINIQLPGNESLLRQLGDSN
jgi:putative ABC transport system substrate-binding protein